MNDKEGRIPQKKMCMNMSEYKTQLFKVCGFVHHSSIRIKHGLKTGLGPYSHTVCVLSAVQLARNTVC